MLIAMSAKALAMGKKGLAFRPEPMVAAKPSPASDLFRSLVVRALSSDAGSRSTDALRRFLSPADDTPAPAAVEKVSSRRDRDREAAFNQVRRFRIAAR